MMPTEKFRAMLDERGIEWHDTKIGRGYITVYVANGITWTVTEHSSGSLTIRGSAGEHITEGITPAQAIAATVGDTCQSVLDPTYYKGIHGYCQSLKCSKCEEPLFKEFRFCPWCGSKVVGA